MGFASDGKSRIIKFLKIFKKKMQNTLLWGSVTFQDLQSPNFTQKIRKN